MSASAPVHHRVGGGTMLIKSVSIFLASGRKASVAGKSRTTAAGVGDGSTSGGGKRKGGKARRMMGDDTTKMSTVTKCSSKMIESLKKRTHFTRQEIEALCHVYRKLVSNNSLNITSVSGSVTTGGVTATSTGMSPSVFVYEGLDRIVFRDLLHNTFDLVTEEVLMDRIFCAFDRCNLGVIRLEEWVTGLSVFLRGTFEERTTFCFLVYDLNSDGFISRDEMFHLLRNCLVKQPQDEDPDEGVKDLVELALRKLDQDKDGKVSFSDFQIAVKEEPLLMEAFGQCLPVDNSCQTFISTLHC